MPGASCHTSAVPAMCWARRGCRHTLLPSEAPGLGVEVERRGVAGCYRLVLFSSSCEFGVALESAGEEEAGEEAVSASQAAIQAVATEEAVLRYIRSQPALYRKVLLYQPLELAELQAELKQQGIRVASGKLLDFLDTQCITFTTAATRKEKLGRKRQQPTGKKRGRAGRPAPRSPVSATSSL